MPSSRQKAAAKNHKAKPGNPIERAQTSIEYLSTFSIALLIILVVLAMMGLNFFGNNSAQSLASSSCYLSAGLECSQIAITNNGVAASAIIIFTNNLGRQINFQNSNSIVVTSGVTQKSYFGNCYPVNAVPGATVVCNVTLSDYSPSIGEQLSPTFQLKYSECISGQCIGYNTSGSGITYVSTNIPLYKITLLTDPSGGTVSVNGVPYLSNSILYFVGDISYSIDAQPSYSGTAFQGWVTQGGVIASNTLRLSSSAIASSNGILEASYIPPSTSTTSTTSSSTTSTSTGTSTSTTTVAATNAATNAASIITTNLATNAASIITTNLATNAASSSTGCPTGVSVYGSANITLANGTTITADSIRAGTMILSYNLVTHMLQPSLVSGVYKLTADNTYTFNNKLKVDGNEIMLINGVWARAYTAKVGDYLFDPLTNERVAITDINVTNTGGNVYDLIGSPVNNYIANGFLIDKDTTTGSDSCTSVAGDSMITLANGSMENVSSVRLGTLVLGYNLLTKTLEPTVVMSADFHSTTTEYIINGNLKVDANEQLIVNGTDVHAANLKIGDDLFDPLTNQNVVVSSIKIITGNFTLYDINTAPVDDYIVNGYLIT